MLDDLDMGFERRGKGSDSFVVRVRLCGQREVVRFPVFGYSPSREVLGDPKQVAVYIAAMWEILLSGWQRHAARRLQRAEQVTTWKLNRVWATDPARLIDACETDHAMGHELWNEVLPCVWAQADADGGGHGFWAAYDYLAYRCEWPQLAAVIRIDSLRGRFELNVDFVFCHDAATYGTRTLGRLSVDIPKSIPQCG